jgi:hypothetical protein
MKKKYLVYILKYHNAHCVCVLCVPDIDKCSCHVCRWLYREFTLDPYAPSKSSFCIGIGIERRACKTVQISVPRAQCPAGTSIV